MAAECKPEQSGVRPDQRGHHEDSDPCGRVQFVSLQSSASDHCEHEVEAADTNGPALDTAQSRFLEQRDDLSWIDVTMTVKVREKARLPLWVPKVHYKHTPLWFEDAPDLAGALLPRLAREVVEHECAQHHVELRLGKRQGLHNGGLETDIDPRPGCLRRGSCDHGRGRVDAKHLATCADLTFGDNRQGAGSASNVEHEFARLKVREAKQLLAKGTIAPVCQEPDEEVVTCGPMQDATTRHGCSVC